MVEKLLFTQTTIPVCDEAVEEASELVDHCKQLDESTMQRLFVLLRGMRWACVVFVRNSEHEFNQDIQVNFQQLVKAYKQGDKAFQRLLEENVLLIQVLVRVWCQRVATIPDNRDEEIVAECEGSVVARGLQRVGE